MAKLAVTPPVVGSVSTLIYKSPASLCLFSAAEVFAICIRETMPSCILAPPDAVNITTGSRSFVALSTALATFSPTFSPMLAIRNRPSQTPSTTSSPSIFAFPVTTASFKPVFSCWSFSFSRYPLYRMGFTGRISLSHSSKLSSSVIILIRSMAGT